MALARLLLHVWDDVGSFHREDGERTEVRSSPAAAERGARAQLSPDFVSRHRRMGELEPTVHRGARAPAGGQLASADSSTPPVGAQEAIHG
jgi:hypothetical protein